MPGFGNLEVPLIRLGMNLSSLLQNKYLDKFIRKPKTERDAIIRKNVINSFLFQFASNLMGLAIVPLSLSYLTKEKYGVWISATAMVLYLQNMNFGLGFGMQNHVSESLANDNQEQARRFVSITYRYSFFIALLIFILGVGASFFIDWNALFNTRIKASELKLITLITFGSFLVSFVAGNLQQVLNATNRTAVPKLLGLFTNVLSILLLVLVIIFSHDNIILAALALGLPNPLIYCLASYWFYTGKLKTLKPRWLRATKAEVRKVFGLGFKFFALQITALLIFQVDIVLVTQYLGPEEVTPYNLVNRYFYFIFFIFSLGITPYWPAFTEAYIRKDFKWINHSLRKLFKLCFLAVGIVLVAFAAAYYLIPIWSRRAFNIYEYTPLLIAAALYVCMMFFVSIVSTFLNATSQLNIQLLAQGILSFLSIPLSILFLTYTNLGGAGVNLSMVICQGVFLVICLGYIMRLIKKELR